MNIFSSFRPEKALEIYEEPTWMNLNRSRLRGSANPMSERMRDAKKINMCDCREENVKCYMPCLINLKYRVESKPNECFNLKLQIKLLGINKTFGYIKQSTF